MYRVHLLLIFTFVLTLVGCAPSLRAGAPSAWEARNVGLPSHASVTSVLFVDAPEPPGLLLAGVYGAESLYVSRDGGDTWRMAGFRDGGRAGVDGQPVHVLARHADNGLLAGTSSGLYRSDAFDAQGEPIWERIDEWPRMRAVYSVAQTATGESLIAGRWPALLAYDGEAVQFTAPVVDEPGAILSVLALDSGLILAGTDGAGLFLSEDQGATWQGADDIGATFVAGLFAAPWDGSLVLARTRNGLFRSQDRGQSWTPTGEEIEGRPDTLLALPDTDTLLLGMSTGHLYNSQDDGATWQPWGDRAAPTAAHGPGLLRDGLFQTLARVEHNGHVRLWAGTQHGLYVSADDGRTWTFHWDVGTPVLNALAITEDNTLYAGSHDGVYRSSDRGVTWEWAGDGLPPRAVTALTLHPHDTKLLYAGMDGGGLWRGDLETETWTHIGWAGNSIPDVLVDGEDPDRLFVRVAFERIYESAHGEDGSLEWQARWDGMSTVTEVVSFAQSNHDADLMFAGGATDFYRSRDRAESWERIGPELAGQSGFFVTVDEDDPQVVYAGATNGPYISRDGGDTWRRWGTGLENRTVTAVARHPQGGHVFYAGTKYAGIYSSVDGGATWALDFDPAAPLGLGHFSVAALHFSPDGSHLYAATNQGFLVKHIEWSTDVAGSPVPMPTAPEVLYPSNFHDVVTPSNEDARAVLRYGMHTVSANPEMLPLIHEAGLDTVVQLFPWWEVEPTRGQYIWQPWDEAVAGAEYLGLNLIVRLDKHPAWAKPDPLMPGAPPVNLADYARFVRAVAERYQGRVAGYIIWNEPNLALEWSDLPPDPNAYTALLQTGYEAVKAADPHATVISAGLAPTNTHNEEAMDDRLFLEAMYTYGAGSYFDVLGAHPYGFGQPPDDPPGANESLNMARLGELRALMERYGDGDKPVWITEMGWTVAPHEHARWQEVTQEQQAAYWVLALAQIRREWPWVELITAWNLGGQAHPDWGGYSLLGLDGRPRPAYTALQQAVIGEYGPRALPQRAQPGQVTVLASDAVVHLGDAPHIGQPWVPIYRARAISPDWEGRVYLQDPGDGDWGLTLRVMQSNFWSNVVWINGAPLPYALPPEDFSRSWVAFTLPVPADMLRPGPNTIGLTIAQAPPLIQARSFAYDELQIKDIVLVAPRN